MIKNHYDFKKVKYNIYSVLFPHNDKICWGVENIKRFALNKFH